MAPLQNRSLERGIAVLETLARCGPCSLADLHRECGLAKSTIRRLLATLMARRIVRRSLSDGLYRTSMTLPAIAGVPMSRSDALLADRAMPYLAELTRAVNWPSDIHLFQPPHMRIVDSTRPLSPFHLYRGVVDQRLNIFGCASGMACMAGLEETEVAMMDRMTRGDPVRGLARFGLTLSAYLRELETTRRQGYGTRLSRYLGETVPDDRLAAIAVPIFRNEEVAGAVTLLWPRAFRSAEAFAAEYLGDLRRTAETVTAALAGAAPPGLMPRNPDGAGQRP